MNIIRNKNKKNKNRNVMTAYPNTQISPYCRSKDFCRFCKFLAEPVSSTKANNVCNTIFN